MSDEHRPGPQNPSERVARSGTVGGYAFEAILGRGGMGVVYLSHAPDGRAVAVKVLREDLAREDVYRQRFLRETRIASSVRHRNLVPVLDAGIDGDRPFIVFPFVEGPTLEERIAEAGSLDGPTTIRVIGEVASGLDALHEEGLVHRDVSPANVLLAGEQGACLTDFGLARGDADSVLTQAGRVVGRIDYLAPEVIEQSSPTPLTDVYALGCVCYACLTGRPPFADKGWGETAVAHLSQEPAPPDSISPGIPPELSWAVLTALAKRPKSRPTTATAYANILRGAVAS